MTESRTTTENISDGTAGQSSETFLDFLRRTIPDGIDIDAVDDGECFQESAVRGSPYK